MAAKSEDLTSSSQENAVRRKRHRVNGSADSKAPLGETSDDNHDNPKDLKIGEAVALETNSTGNRGGAEQVPVPVLVMLDLDHCLIHYMKEADFALEKGFTAKSKCWEATVEIKGRHVVVVRKGVSNLILTLKQLGVRLEVVTQNLNGKEILNALTTENWRVWRNIKLTVVYERQQRSKSLRKTNLFKELMANGYSFETLASMTVILDDQEGSWCLENLLNVLEIDR